MITVLIIANILFFVRMWYKINVIDPVNEEQKPIHQNKKTSK